MPLVLQFYIPSDICKHNVYTVIISWIYYFLSPKYLIE